MNAATAAHTATSNNGTTWTVSKINGNYAIFENGEYRTHRHSLKSARTWANIAASHAA